MRAKATVAFSCSAAAACFCCDAFVVPAASQQQPLPRLPSTTTSSSSASVAASSPARPLATQGARASLGVRRARRDLSVLSVSSFDAAGDSAAAPAVPVGPGAGVIDLKFENLKAGGFKVFLLLFLLGVSVNSALLL